MFSLIARIRIAACLFLLLDAGEAFARAGGARPTTPSVGYYGHPSGGKGDEFTLFLDLLQFILITCMIVSSCHIYWQFRSHTAKTKKLLDQYAAADSNWEPAHLKKIVREVFLKVQAGWTEQNLESYRSCVTSNLYADHLFKIEKLVASGRKNVLDEIFLTEITFFRVKRGVPGVSYDEFCVCLTGHMVDYEIELLTGRVRKGNKKAHLFKELWVFVRRNDEWLLDEIESKVNMSELAAIRRRFA